MLSTTDPSRGSSALVVRPFTVRLLLNGKISHPKQYALHQVGTPARYLRPSDRIILARLRRIAADQLNRATDEDPVDTLRRVIATGRAFWGSADGPKVTEGKPRSGTIVWKLAQDGTQQTVLALEEGLAPLDSTMLWYVEPRSGTVGPITLDIPARAAARLLRSPPVPPELAERVTAELRQRLPTLPVPVPCRCCRRRRGSTVGRGLISRLINGDVAARPGAWPRARPAMLAADWYEVPLARLAFRYGPLTVPSTIKPPPRRVSHDGRLYDLASRPGRRAENHRSADPARTWPRRPVGSGELSARPYRRFRAE